MESIKAGPTIRLEPIPHKNQNSDHKLALHEEI
jgi:hypothetical protein